MKIARFARILLCFVLVCALLVNVSPIKAHATGGMLGGLLSGSTVLVPAGPVIAAALIGLGIYAVAESGVFDSLVDNIKTELSNFGRVLDDEIELAQIRNGESSTYAIDQELLDSIRSLAISLGAITSSAPSLSDFLVPAGTTMVTQWWKTTYPVDVYCFTVPVTSSVYEYYIVTDIPFDTFTSSYRGHDPEIHEATFFDYNGYSIFSAYGSCVSDSSYGAYLCSDLVVSSGLNLKEFAYSAVCGLISLGEPETSVADGLAAGYIGNPSSSLAEAYPDWKNNIIEFKQDEEQDPKPYWPVGIGSTYEETVTKTQEDIWQGVSEYTSQALENWDSLLNATSSIRATLSNIWNSLTSGFNSVVEAVQALPAAFTDILSDIKSAIVSIPSSISGVLEGLWEDLRTWWNSITDAITTALAAAFLVDKTYMLQEIQGLTNNFPFLSSMVDFCRSLADVFYGIGSKPPILYVDLSASESEVITGEKVVFLDLTWYERYKPYGDSILSAFMYAWFGWKLLQTLPSLLNGSSGAVPNASTFRRRDD